jgi:hypothetical protein
LGHGLKSSEDGQSSTVSDMPQTNPSRRGKGARYAVPMKKLILIGVVAAIAAVLYKVLTTEIPIKE